VPYRGSAPALNDLLGGHIDVMFDAMPMMSVQAKEGKVTPLAVTGAKRAATLPEVGTMRDSGLTYELTGWYGILAPAGTPQPIVEKMAKAIEEALKSPDVLDKLDKGGAKATYLGPADMRAQVTKESAMFGDIIKRGNVKTQ